MTMKTNLAGTQAGRAFRFRHLLFYKRSGRGAGVERALDSLRGSSSTAWGRARTRATSPPPFRLFTRTGWHPSHPRSSVHHATGSSSTASPRDDRAEDRGGVPGGDAAAEAEAPPSVSAAESPAASRAAPRRRRVPRRVAPGLARPRVGSRSGGERKSPFSALRRGRLRRLRRRRLHGGGLARRREGRRRLVRRVRRIRFRTRRRRRRGRFGSPRVASVAVHAHAFDEHREKRRGRRRRRDGRGGRGGGRRIGRGGGAGDGDSGDEPRRRLFVRRGCRRLFVRAPPLERGGGLERRRGAPPPRTRPSIASARRAALASAARAPPRGTRRVRGGEPPRPRPRPRPSPRSPRRPSPRPPRRRARRRGRAPPRRAARGGTRFPRRRRARTRAPPTRRTSARVSSPPPRLLFSARRRRRPGTTPARPRRRRRRRRRRGRRRRGGTARGETARRTPISKIFSSSRFLFFPPRLVSSEARRVEEAPRVEEASRVEPSPRRPGRTAARRPPIRRGTPTASARASRRGANATAPRRMCTFGVGVVGSRLALDLVGDALGGGGARHLVRRRAERPVAGLTSDGFRRRAERERPGCARVAPEAEEPGARADGDGCAVVEEARLRDGVAEAHNRRRRFGGIGIGRVEEEGGDDASVVAARQRVPRGAPVHVRDLRAAVGRRDDARP